MLLAYSCSVCGKKAPKKIIDSLLTSPNRTRLCTEVGCKGQYAIRKQDSKLKIAIPSDFEDDLVVDAVAGAALGPDISDVAGTERPRLPNIPTKKKDNSEED
ncbi:MAG: hypothetical protein ACXAB4_13060 [Candidatus Hodarchaeales archaeon]|jgi:hypothetical protein